MSMIVIRRVLFTSAEKSADVLRDMPMTEAERGMAFRCGHEMPMDTPWYLVDETRNCPACSNALYHQHRAREQVDLAERVRIQRETLLALVRSGGAGRRHLILLGILTPDDQIKHEILAADQFFRRVMP